MLSLRHRPICCQILGKVSDDVACDLHRGGGPGITGGELRVDAGSMIDEIGIKAGGLDLLLIQVPGKLMDNGADHFQMPQLLGADVR